jgi:hypothetical protein
MERPGGGILGRLTERIVGYVALGLIVLAGVALYRMGPAGRDALWQGAWRTAAWLAIAAVVPWMARLFIGRLVELGSNWAGVVLIAAFTIVDLLVGLLLIGGLPVGGWSWLAAVASLAVAGTYNYLVSEYLAQQAAG